LAGLCSRLCMQAVKDSVEKGAGFPLRVPRLVASPLNDDCPVSKADLPKAGPPDYVEEGFAGGEAWRVLGIYAHGVSPDAALRLGGSVKTNPQVGKSLSLLTKSRAT
jgi:hypothetical protein